MTTLIGSRALRHYFEDSREPDDTDYFSKDDIPGAECFWHDDLASWNFGEIATPDEQYTIKVSHSFWNIKWEKHIADIVFLQRKGAQFIPELYDILYPLWAERYGKKKAYLNTRANEFFDDNVDRTYEHDSIHESISYYDRPLFERILKDGEEVAVDKAKFDALEYDDKCRLVREEVYATALERYIIPENVTSPGAAYSKALKQLIVSYSKGWFPLFVVLNFDQLKRADVDYIKRFNDNQNRLRRLDVHG